MVFPLDVVRWPFPISGNTNRFSIRCPVQKHISLWCVFWPTVQSQWSMMIHGSALQGPRSGPRDFHQDCGRQRFLLPASCKQTLKTTNSLGFGRSPRTTQPARHLKPRHHHDLLHADNADKRQRNLNQDLRNNEGKCKTTSCPTRCVFPNANLKPQWVGTQWRVWGALLW